MKKKYIVLISKILLLTLSFNILLNNSQIAYASQNYVGYTKDQILQMGPYQLSEEISDLNYVISYVTDLLDKGERVEDEKGDYYEVTAAIAIIAGLVAALSGISTYQESLNILNIKKRIKIGDARLESHLIWEEAYKQAGRTGEGITQSNAKEVSEIISRHVRENTIGSLFTGVSAASKESATILESMLEKNIKDPKVKETLIDILEKTYTYRKANLYTLGISTFIGSLALYGFLQSKHKEKILISAEEKLALSKTLRSLSEELNLMQNQLRNLQSEFEQKNKNVESQ